MKNYLLFFLVCLSIPSYSQSYTFSHFLAEYKPLNPDSTISINKGVLWDDDTTFSFPIGFTFHFINQDYTEMKILLGNALFGSRYTSFAPCAAVVMQDRADSGKPSLSPISYQLTGDSGSRILKVQWENAGFLYDTASFANFQAWFYEGSNKIEARYGKSHVESRLFQTQHGGPQVGILAVKDTGTDSFRVLLNGNPDSPYAKGINDNGPYSLTAMPRDSTVYVFEYSTLSGIAPAKQSELFSFYPNPATNVLHINCSSYGILTIRNITGEIIYTGQINGFKNIDLNTYPKGMYFVSVNTTNGQEVRKLIVE